VAAHSKNSQVGPNDGDSSQRVSSSLMRALEHPLRREILRMLHTSTEPRSPNELSKRLANDLSLSGVAYHVRTLARFGVVTKVRSQQVRGSTERFYRSGVSDHIVVLTILADTQEEDRHDKFGRRSTKT
jgi:predicted transcriptional regulator